MSTPHPLLLGAVHARQVDATSCGAAALIAARAGVDPEFGAAVGRDERLFEAVQAHVRRRTARRALGPVRWPLALGTTPWTAARELSRVLGVPYRHVPLVRGRGSGIETTTSDELAAVAAAAWSAQPSQASRAALPSLLFTGHSLRDLAGRAVGRCQSVVPSGAAHLLARVPDRILVPRHVLAVLPQHEDPGVVDVYEPGSGTVTRLPLEALTAPEPALDPAVRRAFGGWTHLTWVVRPARQQGSPSVPHPS